MNNEVMFSSKSDNWSTPKDFYEKLNSEFNFTYDPCPLNADFDSLSLSLGTAIYSSTLRIVTFVSSLKKESQKSTQETQMFASFLFLHELTRDGFTISSMSSEHFERVGMSDCLKGDLSSAMERTALRSLQCFASIGVQHE